MKENIKKIMVASIITLLLIVGTVSLTFAFLSVSDKQEIANSFTSGCLNISIENEGNAISLSNTYPITDIEGLKQEGYTFSIKNTCSTSTKYQINLESLNLVSNTLSGDYIKVSLSNNTMGNMISILSSNPETTASIAGAYISNRLYTGTIAGNTSKDFNLKLWLDYDATKEQAANKTYTSKINVIANPDLIADNTSEIKYTLNGNALTGTITGEATSAKYCITNDNLCTPNIDTTITDNKINIEVDRVKDKIVCVMLDGETICSNIIEKSTLLAVGGETTPSSNFLGSDKTRADFERVTTLDNINIPEGAHSWDVSTTQDRSIMAWYTDEDNNGKYELYIGQLGGVVANPDSSFLFNNFSNVTSMDLSKLITSNVTSMRDMVASNNNLASLDVSNFDTSKVTNMQGMFYNSKITTLDLSNFDTRNVTNMHGMFDSASSLTILDVGNFNTSNVTDMNKMFYNTSSLTSLDLSSFNTSNVTDMDKMFYNTSSLTSLDLSSFNTSNVTNMANMFRGASSLTRLDVSSFDTSNVHYMWSMFNGASSLTSLDVSSFDTSNVIDMGDMFNGASSLTSLDLSNFDTSKVTFMGYMFYRMSSLTSLKLDKADFSNVTSYNGMLDGTPDLSSITVKDTSAQTFINARLNDFEKTGVTVIIA